MKNTIILFGIILSAINLQAQDCYSVNKVENKSENTDLSSKKFTFGVKQIAEELIGDKKTLCDEGLPIYINIISIEAPSIGINIGPFMIKKKITEIKTEVIIDGVVHEGFGQAKLSVRAGFAELRDENLPFEKSVFASAIKKSLENAIQKI
jgi:hypothetical protein